MTDRLSQNAALQFAVISYVVEYFSRYLVCIQAFSTVYEITQNVCRGMLLPVILRLCHSPSWFHLLQILMQCFEIIISVHTNANKPAAKSNKFFLNTGYILMASRL